MLKKSLSVLFIAIMVIATFSSIVYAFNIGAERLSSGSSSNSGTATNTTVSYELSASTTSGSGSASIIYQSMPYRNVSTSGYDYDYDANTFSIIYGSQIGVYAWISADGAGHTFATASW